MQQLIELGRQVEELELAAAIGGGGVGTDELADARGVDRRDAGKIEQLKKLLADTKKLKADDFVKVFSAPAGGDVK